MKKINMKLNRTLRYIVWFLFFVLFQGLILNYINIGGYVSPLAYIMFIILLPFDTPKALSLIIAFILGYVIDLFSGTPGMHAAACVMAAFFRPFLIKATTKDVEDITEQEPTIKSIGFRRILMYTLYIVAIHHTIFFIIESLRFSEIFQILTRILLSSASTIILIMLLQMIFFSRKRSSRRFS